MQPLILALASVALGFVDLQWTLPGAAKSFSATIGPQCLSDSSATISAEGNIISVYETAPCAKELRELSKTWLDFADEPIVTLTGSPEALSAARERLEAKYGRSPNARLRFLNETQHCRCLVMTGKRSMEAGDVAGLEPAAPAEKSARPVSSHKPMESLPGNLDPSMHDQGLIWQNEPTKIDSSAPLVN